MLTYSISYPLSLQRHGFSKFDLSRNNFVNIVSHFYRIHIQFVFFNMIFKIYPIQISF
jgi:hypothetical protein